MDGCSSSRQTGQSSASTGCNTAWSCSRVGVRRNPFFILRGEGKILAGDNERLAVGVRGGVAGGAGCIHQAATRGRA